MNKLTNKRNLALLAALPAAILAANLAYADDVTVYGKINVSDQHSNLKAATNGVSTTYQDNYALDSNASRFGVMGNGALGDSGLKGVFKIEYQVAVDSGDNGKTSGITGAGGQGFELKQRNVYGGLQGDFGTVIAGKFDTTTKVVGDQVDMFHDLIIGDIKNVVVGEDRLDNTVMYSTPKLMDSITVNVQIAAGEQAPNGDTATTNWQYRGLADTKILSVVYDTPELFLALAHNENSLITTAATSAYVNPTTVANPEGAGQDITRLVAQFKPMSDLALGALYQTAKAHDSSGVDNLGKPASFTGNPGLQTGAAALPGVPFEKQKGYVLSASYTMANNVFKLQYGNSKGDTTQTGDSSVDQKVTAVGYDYKLGAKAKVFAYYAKYKGTYSKTGTDDSLDANTFAVGYEQKF